MSRRAMMRSERDSEDGTRRSSASEISESVEG